MKAAVLSLASMLLLSTTSSVTDKWPTDVNDFILMSESCYHWLGEAPYDAERAAEIKGNVAKSCNGLPKQLAKLKKRHAHDLKILTLLKEFDPKTGLSDKFPGG